jgi:hypothetical protein
MLRRIFGPKMEEVAGGWRKLHNEELHNLHIAQNNIRVIKSRRMGWGGACSTYGRKGKCIKMLAESGAHLYAYYTSFFALQLCIPLFILLC